MCVSRVEDSNKHIIKIKKIKKDLLYYKEATAETILIISTMSDSENFYAHIIFQYYLQLVNRIFKIHNIGI